MILMKDIDPPWFLSMKVNNNRSISSRETSVVVIRVRFEFFENYITGNTVTFVGVRISAVTPQLMSHLKRRDVCQTGLLPSRRSVAGPPACLPACPPSGCGASFIHDLLYVDCMLRRRCGVESIHLKKNTVTTVSAADVKGTRCVLWRRTADERKCI